MELFEILTIFTSIDFSSNHFKGPILGDLIDFKAPYSEIPPSIGNIREQESLDLSQNS